MYQNGISQGIENRIVNGTVSGLFLLAMSSSILWFKIAFTQEGNPFQLIIDMFSPPLSWIGWILSIFALVGIFFWVLVGIAIVLSLAVLILMSIQGIGRKVFHSQIEDV
jgi:hypothetical protein